MGEDLVHALADLKEEEAIRITQERLNAEEDPLEILEDATRAMEIVGERFADESYFIPDLVYSGEILRKISEMIKPKLPGTVKKKESIGKFLIGTVAGDIHDIGKDIVKFMLDVHRYQVYDLGVDVSPEIFVNKIREVEPDIVGLSGLLTIAFGSMKETIDAIDSAGLREKLKIVVGGPQVDDQIRKYSGADAYCRDAMCVIALAKEWIGGK